MIYNPAPINNSHRELKALGVSYRNPASSSSVAVFTCLDLSGQRF